MSQIDPPEQLECVDNKAAYDWIQEYASRPEFDYPLVHSQSIPFPIPFFAPPPFPFPFPFSLATIPFCLFHTLCSEKPSLWLGIVQGWGGCLMYHKGDRA